MTCLELNNLNRHYQLDGRLVRAIDDLSLTIRRGSFTTLVGRSGCGKTTLLRLLAGLETPTGGTIRHTGATTPRIGFVFQEPRLLPWATVAENIAFPLKGHQSDAQIAAKVAELLAMLGLTDFATAYPRQISGGMAQRTALGRALAWEPELLLLDEPFGALDYFTRRKLQEELVALFQRQAQTILFVTHDVEEALVLSERVLVLAQGRLQAHYDVSFPYPRDIAAPEFLQLRKQILAAITSA